MGAVSAFLKYAAIRMALFIVPFGLLVAVGWNPLLSGGIALVFAFCAAYIFFGKQKRELDEAMQRAAEKRKRRENETGAVRGEDEASEDALTAESHPEEADEAASEDAADVAGEHDSTVENDGADDGESADDQDRA